MHAVALGHFEFESPEIADRARRRADGGAPPFALGRRNELGGAE